MVRLAMEQKTRKALSARYVTFAIGVTGFPCTTGAATVAGAPGAARGTAMLAAIFAAEVRRGAFLMPEGIGAGAAAPAAAIPCAMACVRMSCEICPELSDAWIF